MVRLQSHDSSVFCYKTDLLNTDYPLLFITSHLAHEAVLERENMTTSNLKELDLLQWTIALPEIVSRSNSELIGQTISDLQITEWLLSGTLCFCKSLCVILLKQLERRQEIQRMRNLCKDTMEGKEIILISLDLTNYEEKKTNASSLSKSLVIFCTRRNSWVHREVIKI